MSAFRLAHGFSGRLVMVGFGCIGQGALPLLFRHLGLRSDQVQVVTPGESAAAVAREYGVRVNRHSLRPDNHREVLEALLSPGDFLLNLAVDVSSVALIEWCQAHGVLYLDTCIEPWAGGYIDPELSNAARTNYALREAALALRPPGQRGQAGRAGQAGPTAVLTHGANPGLVSHLLKQALLDIAADLRVATEPPASREQWARLSQRLGVRCIHIAERDTQFSPRRKRVGEFVNTWSVDAFVDEARQPAELGWGSHEKHFPADAERHAAGCKASIFLKRPGAATRVRSWTPLAGPQHAFLVTHAESISIADHLTLGSGDAPAYRPTVHYAYHPCDDAVLSLHELAGHNWRLQQHKRVLKDDIAAGTDELGVLLMGHARGAYWYGSQLSVDQARALCPHNSATSLQVTAAVMAGVVWAMQNPDRGIVEPDDMPHAEILDLCRPYLGTVTGFYSGWTPLDDRGWLFEEDVDRDDPWQFKNFRVT